MALRLKIDVRGIEAKSGIVENVGEDPEADRFIGVIRGVAKSQLTVFEAVELSDENMDEGPISPSGILGSHGGSDPRFDLSGERLLQEEEEEAGWHGGVLVTDGKAGEKRRILDNYLG